MVHRGALLVISPCAVVVSTAAVVFCLVLVDGGAVVVIGAPVVVVRTGHTASAFTESKREKFNMVDLKCQMHGTCEPY